MNIQDINIYIYIKYVIFRKIVICMFKKNNLKLLKQIECDKDYGIDVLKGLGLLFFEIFFLYFEGLIFLIQRL